MPSSTSGTRGCSTEQLNGREPDGIEAVQSFEFTTLIPSSQL